jgi:transcriptional regulator with XRE-family HTH domain
LILVQFMCGSFSFCSRFGNSGSAFNGSISQYCQISSRRTFAQNGASELLHFRSNISASLQIEESANDLIFLARAEKREAALLAGDKLRKLREDLGLTLRDVEAASVRLSAMYRNADYALPISRLSDIETKSSVPNIFRLYSLAVIYRISMRELLALFGVDLNKVVADSSVANPAQTHKLPNSDLVEFRMPVKLDPAFNFSKTSNLGRFIMQWGTVPLAFLEKFESNEFTYGYIGSEDFTMYPLLLPGSFVQVDEAKNKVLEGGWRSEYERPIYFVLTRNGYTCCWCDQEGPNTVLLAHPLSPVKARSRRSDRDVEIVGQVVGVAMRLDWADVRNGAVTQLLSKST